MYQSNPLIAVKKSLALLGLVIATSTVTFAQEKTKELGFTTTDFKSFGLTFRTGSPNGVFRINSIVGNGYSEKDDASNNNIKDNKGFQTNLSFGYERRKNIKPNFQIRYGADLGIGYQVRKTTYEENSPIKEAKISVVQPGFNLVFGANYVINDHVVVGFEMLPSFFHTIEKNEAEYADNIGVADIDRETKNWDYELTSNRALISIAYRW